MRVLTKQDYIEVTLKSLVADYDYETMANLYQPIIGYAAMSLYFTLVFEAKNQRVYSINKHEEIFMKMDIAPSVFLDSRKRLEAVGLIKTYFLKENGTNIYHYDIFAPRSPNLFFDNALLYGMLIKCIGEEASKKIKMIYAKGEAKDYGEDISSKFTEVYHPKFDDPEFIKAINDKDNAVGRNAGTIEGNFSYELFFKELAKISSIKEEDIKESEMSEVYRLATLNAIDEIAAAKFVSTCYQANEEKGNRINLKILAKMFQKEADYSCLKVGKAVQEANLNNGTTELARKINLMETKSPKSWLMILQNGTRPAGADLRLIEDLSSNFKLPNSVINVVIEYVLNSCNNVLSRAFAEKIAASLARESITTAIDAMNYLNKVNSKGIKSVSNKKSFDKIKRKETLEEPKENNQPNESVDEDDGPTWDELLDEIDQGGTDGKA